MKMRSGVIAMMLLATPRSAVALPMHLAPPFEDGLTSRACGSPTVATCATESTFEVATGSLTQGLDVTSLGEGTLPGFGGAFVGTAMVAGYELVREVRELAFTVTLHVRSGEAKAGLLGTGGYANTRVASFVGCGENCEGLTDVLLLDDGGVMAPASRADETVTLQFAATDREGGMIEPGRISFLISVISQVSLGSFPVPDLGTASIALDAAVTGVSVEEIPG